MMRMTMVILSTPRKMTKKSQSCTNKGSNYLSSIKKIREKL